MVGGGGGGRGGGGESWHLNAFQLPGLDPHESSVHPNMYKNLSFKDVPHCDGSNGAYVWVRREWEEGGLVVRIYMNMAGANLCGEVRPYLKNES